ncbi:hypothetical protein H5410_038520 [Solanum commersonii]|uniref:Uncharacterized protein n=1 Tax=Solanum commersonii TaxID=4109 RepID=A0A9J5YCI9_SOLCO|nr:hypothetical protein H5410_038520 [Solanum commersonii]
MVDSSRSHFFPGNVQSIGEFRSLLQKKFDFFNRNDPTALGMINQVADGGHIGASYVLAIISIFNGGESMREEPHLLGGRPFVALFINLSKSVVGMVGPWEATMKIIFVVNYVVLI